MPGLCCSLEDPKEVISKLLGAPIRLLTSRCVLTELKALGKDFKGTHTFARKACAIHACGHEDTSLAASSCLSTCIGISNPEHFFVATQDPELRKAIADVPGGAVIFMSGNGIHLEQPSRLQQQAADQEGQQQAGVSAQELQSGALKDLAELQKEPKQKSLFRRNRAKGPNPLSMRKAKRKASHTTQQAAPETEPHRKRRRRKGNAEAPAAEAPSST